MKNKCVIGLLETFSLNWYRIELAVKFEEEEEAKCVCNWLLRDPGFAGRDVAEMQVQSETCFNLCTRCSPQSQLSLASADAAAIFVNN